MFRRTALIRGGFALALLTALLITLSILPAEASHAAQEEAPTPPEIRDRPGLRSRVIALDGDALTINHDGQPLVILVNEETVYRVAGEAEPGLDDVAVDDIVFVRTFPQDDTTLATFIARSPRGDRIGGRVRSVAESQLTVQHRQFGELDIDVSDTTLVVRGEEELAWGAGGAELVAPGAAVAAFGVADRDARTFDAETIVVVRPARPQAVRGEITALEGDSFTLETPRGAVDVMTNDRTRFRHPDVAAATLADFAVGDRVVVVGRLTAAGSGVAYLVATR